MTTPWHHCAAVRPCPSNTPREPGTPACAGNPRQYQLCAQQLFSEQFERALLPWTWGCVTDAERQLWTQLADEVDAYLDPHPTLEGM